MRLADYLRAVRAGGGAGRALKMQDVKMTDRVAMHEIARHENAGHEIATYFSILECLLW